MSPPVSSLWRSRFWTLRPPPNDAHENSTSQRDAMQTQSKTLLRERLGENEPRLDRSTDDLVALSMKHAWLPASRPQSQKCSAAALSRQKCPV